MCIEGCKNKDFAKNLCVMHYRRMHRHGTTELKKHTHAPVKDRFMRSFKINEITGCWDWLNALDAYGYGGFSWNEHPKAHRAAWTLFHGPIPDGLHVLHTCDNRKCVNPEHLWIGTNADNMRDKQEKGRFVLGKRYSGEENYASKLKTIDAVFIFNSSHSYTHLAKMFNVSKTAIASIKKKRSWKHIHK